MMHKMQLEGRKWFFSIGICDNLFLAQESDGDVMAVPNNVTSFILVLYHNTLVHTGILFNTLRKTILLFIHEHRASNN